MNQHSLHFDCQLLAINCSQKLADQENTSRNIHYQNWELQVHIGQAICEQVQLNRGKKTNIAS